MSLADNAAVPLFAQRLCGVETQYAAIIKRHKDFDGRQR
jgi:hypothetical protein